MKNWKKIAVAGGLAVAVAGIALAAGPDGPIGRRARLMRLMRELGISREQARDLKAAGVHLMVERRALDMEELPGAERKQRLFQLRREFFAGAEKVLTPEQKEKLKAKWEEARSARQHRLEQKAAEIGEKLHFTPEQKGQVSRLVQETRVRVEQVKEDPKLDDPARLATIVGTLEESKGRFYRLMTPEQREQAKGMLEAGIKARLPAEGVPDSAAP